MPERAQFIRSHLPRVAPDPPVRSRLGAERDPSFASHASSTSLLAKKAGPPIPSRSREVAFFVGAGGLEVGKAESQNPSPRDAENQLAARRTVVDNTPALSPRARTHFA